MKKLLITIISSVGLAFAGGDSFHEYAKVNYSEPIYEYINKQIPQEKCEQVIVRNNDYDDRQNYTRNDSLGIDTLVGVAAGTILGSQIGKGNGRVASQIVGGLLGGKIAHEVRHNYNNSHDSGSNYRYETRTECYNTYRNVERKVLTGYKNYFVYKGKRHYKITNNPIKRVKIIHSINF